MHKTCFHKSVCRAKSNSVVEVKPFIFISYVVTLCHPVLDAMSKYGAASLVQEINTAISGQIERYHAIVFSTPFAPGLPY